MKDKSKVYLIVAILFLIVGIVLLVTGALSSTMAYGDFVFAIVFFAMYKREKNQSNDQ